MEIQLSQKKAIKLSSMGVKSLHYIASMNNTLNKKSSIGPDEGLDFGQIFRSLLMQSKLIALIVVLFTSLGVFLYLYSEKIYSLKSLIQIYPKQSSMSNSQLDLLMSTNNSDFASIEDLYKSRTNMIDVTIANKLNIDIEELNVERSLIINNIESEKSEYFQIEILFLDDKYIIKDEGKEIAEVNYNELYENDNFRISLSKPSAYEEKFYKFSYYDPSRIAKITSSKFRFSSNALNNRFYGVGNGDVMTISYHTPYIEEGKKILDYSNSLFLDRTIASESEKARKAVQFLDQRINTIEKTLDRDKTNLKNFREQNNSVDVELEIKTIVESLSETEAKINEVNIEISQAARLYTDSNPLFLELLNKRDFLEKERDIIQSKIKNLPLAQQNYIDLYREVEISEQVYEELLSRKLEFSIREASTLGNIRIVDDAYLDIKISPKLNSVFVFIVMGAIVSLLLALIRGFYFIPISNPAELADRKINLPILGVFPKIDEDYKELLSENESLSQSVESTIVNINHLTNKSDNEAKVVLITSATPANGKSFTARNISRKLALLNKKVLLLDLDLKRGAQEKSFDVDKISLRDFENINEENIEKYKTSDSLYLIPKLSKLPSSFQFLYSPIFENKMNFFKKSFDYVILDSAPILSVSDTSILMTISDINIAVLRHGVSKINELKQLLSIADQLGVSLDGFIYNAYEKPSSYYGYYGLYGNYAYQYYAKKYLYESYEYDKKN